MNKTIENYYKKAEFLGMKPYEFDNHIIRYDIFDIDNGMMGRLNMHKYKAAAEHVLKELNTFRECN